MDMAGLASAAAEGISELQFVVECFQMTKEIQNTYGGIFKEIAELDQQLDAINAQQKAGGPVDYEKILGQMDASKAELTDLEWMLSHELQNVEDGLAKNPDIQEQFTKETGTSREQINRMLKAPAYEKTLKNPVYTPEQLRYFAERIGEEPDTLYGIAKGGYDIPPEQSGYRGVRDYCKEKGLDLPEAVGGNGDKRLLGDIFGTPAIMYPVVVIEIPREAAAMFDNVSWQAIVSDLDRLCQIDERLGESPETDWRKLRETQGILDCVTENSRTQPAVFIGGAVRPSLTDIGFSLTETGRQELHPAPVPEFKSVISGPENVLTAIQIAAGEAAMDTHPDKSPYVWEGRPCYMDSDRENVAVFLNWEEGGLREDLEVYTKGEANGDLCVIRADADFGYLSAHNYVGDETYETIRKIDDGVSLQDAMDSALKDLENGELFKDGREEFDIDEQEFDAEEL